MSCGVGHRHNLDPVLLWLWSRPVATAPIQPLTWEPPYAVGAALKRQNKTKQKNKRENKSTVTLNGQKKGFFCLSFDKVPKPGPWHILQSKMQAHPVRTHMGRNKVL